MPKPTHRDYSKEELDKRVKSVKSWAALIKSYDLKITGGTYRHIQQKVHYLRIDTSHFTGMAWNRGETAVSNENVQRITEKLRKYTADRVLVENGPPVKRNVLHKLLQQSGRTYECEECSIVEWKNKPVTLHIDHRNGRSLDHRLTNLRYLCPNCHQQTDTWGSANKTMVRAKEI